MSILQSFLNFLLTWLCFESWEIGFSDDVCLVVFSITVSMPIENFGILIDKTGDQSEILLFELNKI